MQEPKFAASVSRMIIRAGRILASIIEQNNDEFGMILPVSIAPYQVCIVIVDSKDDKQVEEANKIYEELTQKGIDVLLDNRDERVGVKFKDMDLIGIPFRITIGNKIKDQEVEFKKRSEKDFEIIKLESVINVIKQNM